MSGAIATHSQQRVVANCSELRKRKSATFQMQVRNLAARCAQAVNDWSAQRREGAGNAGCLLHPRSRVQMCAKETHTSIQVQSEQSGIPCAMVLRLIPCSPRRRIRLASVADGLKDCPNPVGSTPLRQLDTSNGCQDHTALPYAASPVVCTLCSLTDRSPPCEHDHAPDAAASTATRPNVRDDGQRPSTGTGWGEL
jgi:hypothetical protein